MLCCELQRRGRFCFTSISVALGVRLPVAGVSIVRAVQLSRWSWT